MVCPGYATNQPCPLCFKTKRQRHKKSSVVGDAAFLVKSLISYQSSSQMISSFFDYLTIQPINLPCGMPPRGPPGEDLYASGVLGSPWRLPPGLINENFHEYQEDMAARP